MEKGGNSLTSTIKFFERMRKEIKRSLQVTIAKIKNPGSLGAYRKREKSLIKAYLTLPTTEEEADDADVK